jgi:hypothetical protein
MGIFLIDDQIDRFPTLGPTVLTSEQRRKIRRSIASIQVCGLLRLFTPVNPCGVIHSVKWRLPLSAGLHPLPSGRMAQLILVHSEGRSALKDRSPRRQTIFGHGPLIHNREFGVSSRSA